MEEQGGCCAKPYLLYYKISRWWAKKRYEWVLNPSLDEQARLEEQVRLYE